MSGTVPSAREFDRAVDLHEQALADLASGRLEHAAAAAEQSLASLTDAASPTSPDVANVALTLSNIRAAQGRFADASSAAARALEVMEMLADETDTTLAQLRVQSLVAVGNLLRIGGQIAAAQDRLTQAVGVAEELLGPDHAELAVALNALGVAYKAAWRLDDSEAAYRRALAIVSALPGPRSDALASLYHNLGGLAFARGQAEQGIEWAERGLGLRVATAGADSVEGATQTAALAALYDSAGLHDEAELAYGRALEALQDRLGPEHEVAAVCSNFGVLLDRRGDGDAAQALLRRALAIRRELFGDEHPEVALTLHNLGVALAGLGRDREAIGMLRRAEAVMGSCLPPGHPRHVATQLVLAELLATHERGVRPDPQTVVARFELQADARGDTVACCCAGEDCTYGELERRANRLAHHLHELGVGREVLVALHLERGLEMVVAILAVLKAGGAYLPLDPEHPEDRRRFMVADAATPVIVSRRELWSGPPPAGPAFICLDDDADAIARQPADRLSTTAATDDLAYVIYTSGSTGIPKGVMITHRNLDRLFSATGPWFDFGPDDVWTLFHSFAFDFSVWELWGALAYGGRLVVVPFSVSRSPEAMTQLLIDEQVTVLCQTPSAFRQLGAAVLAAAVTPALRYVIFGGEALDFRALRGWFHRFGDEQPRCINMYGITETTVHVTYRQVHREEAFGSASSCIGVPIPDLDLLVLDEAGQPVGQGEVGELWIAGEGVARGYLNRPELTAQRFLRRDGACHYRSGDLGRVLAGGDIEYIGRADSQVKLRGFRIEPGEIEARLVQTRAVAAAVVRTTGSAESARLVAWCVPAAGAEFDRPALRRALAQTLPDYMIPAALVPIDALPLTINGKLDVAALPAPGREVADHRSPQTDAESLLARLWAEALGGVVEPGRDDNFIALGGTSIAAAGVLAAVFGARGVELSFRDFFDAPTLAELAAVLDAREPAVGGQIVRRPAGSPTVMSFAEQQFHHMARLAPRVPLYAECVAVEVAGPLHTDVFERAVAAVAARHPILRSRYVDAQGVPQRVVDGDGAVATAFYDLRGARDGGSEAEWERFAAARATEPFDLATGPLVRFDVCRLGELEHRILMTFHHIVLDGTGCGAVVGELAQCYRALNEGTVLAPGGRQLSIDDVAAWQGERLEAVVQRELPWWREQLEGMVEVELPADRRRPLLRSFKGARVTRRLPRTTVAQLRELAAEGDTTLFAALLAGFFSLVARHSGQQDITLGTIAAGRARAQAADLPGCLVNALAVRQAIVPERSFRELVATTRDTLLDAHSHGEIPFARLVSELGGSRAPNKNPMFQLAFAATVPVADPLEGWSVRVGRFGNGTARFDLAVQVDERADAVDIHFEYSLDLFDAETVNRLANRYVTLMTGAAAQPSRQTRALSLLDEHETSMLLELGSGPHSDGGTPVLEAFRHQVGLSPGATAVSDEHGVLTYAQLDGLSDAIAGTLVAAGVRREQIVGLATPPCARWVAGMLGILKAGAAFLPLDPGYPSARLQGMLDDARIDVLCCLGAAPAPIAGFTGKIIDLSACEADPEQRALPAIDPADLAYVIYTSGSTGRPKGAQIEHRNLASQIDAYQRIFGLTPSDRIGQFASTSFDASVIEIFPPLCAGAAIVIAPASARLAGVERTTFLRAERITFMFASPGALAVLDASDLPDLRIVLAAGDVLGAEVVDRWWTPDRRVLNGYGPTEATVFASFAQCEPGDPRPPIGPPTAGAHLYVVDEGGQLCPRGVPGELLIAGRGVGRGYLNRPELTAERFIADPFALEGRAYRTGDVVRWRSDGQLEYLGRRDRQIKLRGFRIELGDVEAAVAAHADVARAVAVVREDHPGERRLVAYVVAADEGHAPDHAAIRAYVAAQLPEFMVPAAFVSIAAIPVDANGKIDRRALPVPETTVASVAPAATQLEREILAVWREVLSAPAIGVDDRFFDVGGDSLQLARVQSLLHSRLRLDAELTTLLRYPTVAALAGHIRSAAPGAAREPRR
jgi:amino acid adenylation domain-containing protein